MQTFLLYKNKNAERDCELPPDYQILTNDLELDTLFDVMAGNDDFIFEITKKTILTGTGNDIDTIKYRQSILQDCLNNPAIIREMYRITIEAVKNRKRHWYGIFGDYPSSILSGAREMMEMFTSLLKNLRHIADTHADKFQSQGFVRFYAMLKKELDDDYFAVMESHLNELKFHNGVLISAKLGQGNEGTNYILRRQNKIKQSWIKRIITKKTPEYTFNVHPRDEAGGRALSKLRNLGLNRVANALAQSADHIDNFFKTLRMELAFYIGCINLYDQLGETKNPVVFPVPLPLRQRKIAFHGLYDVCLSLVTGKRVTGNEMNTINKNIIIITGANQGGKSTFLRSIGLAFLMMQCGMFVPAESFCANICNNIFTHYRKEEDNTMQSGKLDEELSRMSRIADFIIPGAMVLFNESFSATNEREGSEIARQITLALSEKKITCFFVTHLYEFPRRLYNEKIENVLFLRAQRQANGKRTFKITEAEPVQTSYGQDLYNNIFEKNRISGYYTR